MVAVSVSNWQCAVHSFIFIQVGGMQLTLERGSCRRPGAADQVVGRLATCLASELSSPRIFSYLLKHPPVPLERLKRGRYKIEVWREFVFFLLQLAAHC